MMTYFICYSLALFILGFAAGNLCAKCKFFHAKGNRLILTLKW